MHICVAAALASALGLAGLFPAAAYQRVAEPRIISAAFSAIITTAALVVRRS